jgi:hypothetical protein
MEKNYYSEYKPIVVTIINNNNTDKLCTLFSEIKNEGFDIIYENPYNIKQLQIGVGETSFQFFDSDIFIYEFFPERMGIKLYYPLFRFLLIIDGLIGTNKNFFILDSETIINLSVPKKTKVMIYFHIKSLKERKL